MTPRLFPAAGPVRAGRKPTARETAFLLVFHATLSGAFLVSYLTGDEDTYGMHVFSGYAILAVLGLRLVVGLAAPSGFPLRLPQPSGQGAKDYLVRLFGGDAAARSERSPLHAWMAAGLLAAAALAALSGVAADFRSRLDDLHEVLSDATLFIVIAHVGLVLSLYALKRWFSPGPVNRTLPRPASGEAP